MPDNNSQSFRSNVFLIYRNHWMYVHIYIDQMSATIDIYDSADNNNYNSHVLLQLFCDNVHNLKSNLGTRVLIKNIDYTIRLQPCYKQQNNYDCGRIALVNLISTCFYNVRTADLNLGDSHPLPSTLVSYLVCGYLNKHFNNPKKEFPPSAINDTPSTRLTITSLDNDDDDDSPSTDISDTTNEPYE